MTQKPKNISQHLNTNLGTLQSVFKGLFWLYNLIRRDISKTELKCAIRGTKDIKGPINRLLQKIKKN